MHLYLKIIRNNSKFNIFNTINNLKKFSTNAVPIIKSDYDKNFENSIERVDPEWKNAKPFESIPAPSGWFFFKNFLPGGKFYNVSFRVYPKLLNEMFGPLVYIKGFFGQKDMLFAFEANDFKTVYRADGPWPIRNNLETFNYFRRVVRPDIFRETGGLTTEQGKRWADMRTQVNPIMLKPKNIKYYIPMVDEISKEFLQRIKDVRNPDTLEIEHNFEHEVNKWALESVAAVALNTRLGLIGKSHDQLRAKQLLDSLKISFQLSFELDLRLSIWKYYKTPKFKKHMKALNTIANISLYYINEAEKRFLIQKKNNPDSPQTDRSILAQLLEINRSYAIILAIDLFFAGVDTTSALLISTLYRMAKHPEKQEILQAEIRRALPEKDSNITEGTMNNLPYLRACIRETLRVTAITFGNLRETTQDNILSGYQIPKGTTVLMVGTVSSHDERNFSRPDDFIPERWLRKNNDQHCPATKPTNPFAFTPFGFGTRMCIGKRFAELEVESALLRILRNFRVEWHHPELQYRVNIINAPCGDIRFKFVDIT